MPHSLTTIDAPFDGFSSYGRPYYEFVLRQKDRTLAIELLKNRWLEFEHLGLVPAAPTSDPRITGSDDRKIARDSRTTDVFAVGRTRDPWITSWRVRDQAEVLKLEPTIFEDFDGECRSLWRNTNS